MPKDPSSCAAAEIRIYVTLWAGASCIRAFPGYDDAGKAHHRLFENCGRKHKTGLDGRHKSVIAKPKKCRRQRGPVYNAARSQPEAEIWLAGEKRLAARKANSGAYAATEHGQLPGPLERKSGKEEE